MIKLIKGKGQWHTQINDVNPLVPHHNIEQAAAYIETFARISPDVVDDAIIEMYAKSMNCATFTEDGRLQEVGSVDVQTL